MTGNCITKIKRAFFLSILLLSAMAIYGYGQTDIAANLTSQLNKYSQQHFQEKLFTHTDKSFYVCGEIIWFKLYNTDAYLNKPVTVSKVAYVELSNAEHKTVLQAKIELHEGKGNGSFMLPFSINSGVYVLRAYTNWMKNFSPDLFFEKQVTVVNTLKKLSRAEKDTSKLDIQFFPEGGNLVSGLRSKVAFHAVDQNGKGITCKGIIVNQKNDTITSFESLLFGMGQFYFTPEKGNSYKAVVQTEGKVMEHNLPHAYETGYVMQLNSTDKQTIRVSVQSRDHDNEAIFLLIHTRQVVKLAQEKILSNGSIEFIISKNELGEGISHFTLFNNKRQPICERLFFIQPSEKLDIEVATNEKEYPLRNKVNIELTSRVNGQAAASDLSLAVFRVDSLQTVGQDDIQSYLWLSSELRGTIESPSYYFIPNDLQVDEAADNLMLTQGWSRFKWENVLNDTKPMFQYLPEYEGPVVTGRVREKKSGLPARNIKAYLTIPAEKFVFRDATSNQYGNIFFNLDKFYGSTDIILQAHNQLNDSYIIDIDLPFANNFSSRKYTSFFLPEKWQEQLTSYSVNTQVENGYVRDKKLVFYLPESTDTTAFYGKPDKTYLLDDYTRFITMEEVMREYVSEVRVRKQPNSFTYKVKNEPLNVFFDNDPLVLLDGLPVFDVSKLMEFDPLKIKRLDLITRKYFSGKDVIEGIVSYTTYKGNLDGFQLNPDALLVEYPGLQLQREFYSPIYETQQQAQSPLPDFRSLLYWSPDVQTGNKGNRSLSFYISDRPGKYAVVVQGISSSGVAGSKVVFLNVNR